MSLRAYYRDSGPGMDEDDAYDGPGWYVMGDDPYSKERAGRIVADLERFDDEQREEQRQRRLRDRDWMWR